MNQLIIAMLKLEPTAIIVNFSNLHVPPPISRQTILNFNSSTCNVDSDLAVHNAAIERPSNEIYYNMSSAESACINFGLQVDKNE